MKQLFKRCFLLFLACVMAVGLMPTAAHAADPLITPGDSISKDEFFKGYYSFTIAKPSEVKFYLSSGGKASNFGSLRLSYSGGWLGDVDGETMFIVSADGKNGPGGRTVVFKLAPGAYTVQLAAQNNVTLTFTSVSPVAEDTGGEPNDLWGQMKKIKAGKTVKGNIFYRGGTYPWARPYDEADYYKFTTSRDNVTIKLTAKRKDVGRSNNFCISVHTNYAKSSHKIYPLNLTKKPSGTLTVKVKKKGTHAIVIDSGSFNLRGQPTEYEFKIEEKGTAKVTGVALSKKKATVKKGETLTLKATVKPSNAKNKSVTWKSSSKKIATVTSKGVVKGIKRGKATITVTTKDGKKTARCVVKVK